MPIASMADFGKIVRFSPKPTACWSVSNGGISQPGMMPWKRSTNGDSRNIRQPANEVGAGRHKIGLPL